MKLIPHQSFYLSIQHNPHPHLTEYNPRVLLKGKCLSKIAYIYSNIGLLQLIFPPWPANCKPYFHFELTLSIRLDSVVEVVKLVRYDNNRVPLTEIFNDGERTLLKKNYYYLVLPIHVATHNRIILNTQSTNNPNPTTMTKMFHSKPLLVKGLQKSLDLVKNGFLIHYTTL